MATSVSERVPLLINRNFALLWIGQSLSQIGDFFFETTLVLWIATQLAKGQSWEALAVSGVALSAAIPVLLIGPIAGVFVDRWPKRYTMLYMDGIRAVLIALMLLITLPLIQLPLAWKLVCIYTALALESTCAQFFNPSRLVIIRDIVPEEQQARAIGFNTATFNVALILGPSLAAPLYFAYGASWAVLIDALSFAASFLTILAIRSHESNEKSAFSQKKSFFQDFIEGLRYLKKNEVIVVLLVAGILFNLGAGASNALYMVFALQNMHMPVGLVGLFASTYGAAVILGSLMAAFFARRIGEIRLLWFSFILWGAAMIVFSRLTAFAPGLILFFIQGLANAGIIVAVGPLKLRHTAREFIGRVEAVWMPGILASQLVAVILAGFLASNVLYGLHSTFLGMRFGPLDTIFTGVGVLAVVAGVYVLYKSITASAAFEAHIESNATQETAAEHPETPDLEAQAQTEASRS